MDNDLDGGSFRRRDPHGQGDELLMAAENMSPALSIVMPVYNEAEALEQVVAEWVTMLDGEHIDYEMRIYDDGSRDGTAEVLQRLAASNPRIIATAKKNSGHGPTIMRGYNEAHGEWVFQTDSDGEMGAVSFQSLWSVRDRYDFLLGEREGRLSSMHRKVLTGGSRAVVALLFGRAVVDVNSPYRLMRGEWLRGVLPLIPVGAAVPNIILTGLASKTRSRVFATPVPSQARRHGASSLNLSRIGHLAVRAVIDAARVAFRRAK
ncbi:MAG TPA: glycosyltransferase family 2 protein [Thermoanaerobaculia bacterium]|nr:glycosyltransferase family 2 protein [Thermoanaerobaculia bacterium]